LQVIFWSDETSRFISISTAAKFDRIGLFAFVLSLSLFIAFDYAANPDTPHPPAVGTSLA
jgi:hypothetical protein